MKNSIKAIVKNLELQTKLIETNKIGLISSKLKGLGSDFYDLKEYDIGDDYKHINWKISAKTNKFYVKNYLEKKEIKVLIAVDISNSNNFQSQIVSKKSIINKLSSILSYISYKNKNKLGLCLFTDKIEYYSPVSKGDKNFINIINKINNFKNQNAETSLKQLLKFLNKVLTKKTLICILSDFISKDIYEKDLKLISKKNDLILIKISDPLENKALKLKYLKIKDLETNKSHIINLKRKRNQKKYQKLYKANNLKLKNTCKELKIDLFNCQSNQNPISNLIKFLSLRMKRTINKC